jgi:hypothetical protein
MDQVMSRTTHPKETKTTNSATEPLKNLIDSITTIAGPAPALTSKDRKRTSKLRKGGEKVIPTILALSDRIGLSVPEYPTATIQANLDKVKTLSPVHEGVVSAEKHLGDAIFQAQAQIWEGATVHYSMLKRLAKTNGDIANALAPVTQFFAHKQPAVVEAEDAKRGHRKGVKEPKGSKTTSAATQGTTSAQAPATPAAPPSAPAAAPAAPPPAPAAAPNGAAHS